MGRGLFPIEENAVTVNQRLLSQYFDLSITKKGPTLYRYTLQKLL